MENSAPVEIVPEDNTSARIPARCTKCLTTAAGVTASDAIDFPSPMHGSQSSTPRKRTFPTMNSLPTNKLKRTPRVTRFLRVQERSCRVPKVRSEEHTSEL